MRIKLFLLLMLAAIMPALAQTASVTGRVVDADTGNPIAGATVTLSSGATVTTGPTGDFSISNVQPGETMLSVEAQGYAMAGRQVLLFDNQSVAAGTIKVYSEFQNGDYYEDHADMLFDEAVMEDEEGNSQTITALTGAADDIYYSLASYNFGPMYFRYRGYDSQYQQVYLNGISFNDVIRGRFNFSTLMGMTSRAFRNKTTTLGMSAADFGFGGLGGAINYNTQASSYAPGFYGTASYTNSNYMLRAMAIYSTGLMKNGWAVTVSGIGRWADEGVIEGTFYNSFGLFAAAEKVFTPNHSLAITAFGGPTQRATSTATYQEAYDLMGSNLYNPNWGWQDGKKRSARITDSFDPTFMLNWLYKTDKTQVNTGAAVRWVNYSSAALNWRFANDPNPTYYRNLPSFWYDIQDNPSMGDYYLNQWKTNPQMSQLNWDAMYQTNYLTNERNKTLAYDDQMGANYIQEKRHSNQFNFMLNSYFNHRLNDQMSVQGGVSGNFTRGHWYKSIRDLLGGDYWLDVDPFSDRETTLDPLLLQNDLDNPNRRVGTGDTFGYNYYINAYKLQAWVQNVINLPHWDLNYGMQIGYTQYQRDGKMRNGRSPLNSLGKGQKHKFDEGGIKIGAVYKIDGRNFLQGHAEYTNIAPLVDNIYISPRIKDDAASNVKTERIISGDIGYGWNYRRFRGAINAFYTQMENVTERSSFYDDRYSSFTNYVLTGVKKVYKGVELGAAYKITPSVTAEVAGTYSRFQYKNNPQGTRSFESGMYADTTQTVYLKNYYVGSTPQYAANVGIDWAAPKNWYFNVNCTWQGDSYVNLSPVYHEVLPELYGMWPGAEVAPDPEKWLEDKTRELATQDKLKDAFTVNLSIGKTIYINRKVTLNLNLSVNNLLNNKDVVTWAYQQGRVDTDNYSRSRWPNRYSYAQGTRVFFNVGVRF